MITVPEILGLIGVAIITIAYALLNLGKISANQWVYPFANFVGALLIIASLLYNWNLSAFVMESTWACVSLFGWVKTWRKRAAN